MNQTTQKTNGEQFPTGEDALFFVEDILGRCQIPFVLLDDVAYAVRNNLDQDFNTPVTVGVKKKHLNEFARKTLPMFLPADALITESRISFTHKDTPVKIKIISKNFKVLERPDVVWYKITQFAIPNPFDAYWKMRKLL